MWDWEQGYAVFALTSIFWHQSFLFLLLSLTLNSEILTSSFPSHCFELILYIIPYCSLSDYKTSGERNMIQFSGKSQCSICLGA